MSPSADNANGRTITLHMVSSLDGFIAKKDNTVAWLDAPEASTKPGLPFRRNRLRSSSERLTVM